MAEVERLLYNCEEIGIIKGTNQGEGRAAVRELSVEKHHRSLRIKGACHRISFEARVPGLPDKNNVTNITIYTHLDTYNFFPNWTKSIRLNSIDMYAHGLDLTQDELTILYKDLAQQNEELSEDINQLEQLLSSHVSTQRDRPKQEQGKKEATSIWKHGKKRKLHGYKSGSELSTSVSEPVLSTNKRCHEDGTSRVNRFATATKIQIKEGGGKRNITSSHPIVTKEKVGIVTLKGEEEANISFNNSKVTSEKLPQRKNESNYTEKFINRNASASSKAGRKPKGSTASSPASETALDEFKCEKADKSPKGHTQNPKSKVLEKLIKKAGVEEKLKEFKTTTSEMPSKSRSNGLSLKVSKSSREVSNKSGSEKKTPSSKMGLSAKAVLPTDVAVSDSEQLTNQTTTSGKSNAGPKEPAKSIKLQDSITNQKRRQILSGKQTNQDHTVPKPKPCDEEVQNWIESLKLKETQKYVDLFGDHEIDMKNVHLLTRNDLREMGINALGPLNSLCSAIDILAKEKEVKMQKDKFQEQTRLKSKGSLKKTSKASTSGSSFMKAENKNGSTEEQNNATTQKIMSNVKEPESKCKRVKSLQPKAKISEPISVAVSQKGKEFPVKESEMAKGEGTKMVVKSVSENSEKRSPKPDRKEPKKISKRKPISAPLPKQDSAVNDFKILRRPPSARQSMAMSVAHIGLPDQRNEDVSVPRPATASSGGRKSNKSELDTILNDMTHQVEALQLQSDNDPSSRQLVEMLQGQILEVQEQISALSNDTSSGKPVSGARPKTASAAGNGTGPVTSALQGNLRPRKGVAQEEEKLKEELTDVVTSLTDGKPLSAAMTKQAILKEVRKQKDDYRKQIKHLESELSRIKYQDPMKGCEITESEVFFSDADLIGEGAFSCVYRGSYQGSEVAVKQLKIPLSSQDKNYFAAEVHLLKELRHPRIVLLMGVCTTVRLPLMVLEYMNGGSLYTYLHNGQGPPLDHAAYFQVARDIALGMNYLHLHRPSVLHLDLKSMNVLLNQHLRAKIADFGFSKLKHEAETACQSKVKEDLKGTPAWMAPELLDAKQITAKADVYSFGIVLWEMLTRKQPYQGYSTFQILEKVRNNKRPEIPAQCPVGLANLTRRCWEQNPGKRPSFKEILSQLDELHFPTEWRELFKVAGVPPSALQDIQSSRTLINIVTNTVEDSGVGSGTSSEDCNTGDGVGFGHWVDKLDLDFLEPRATYRKADETLASQAWSEINVRSEHSITSLDQSHNPYNFVIGVGCDDENAVHKGPSPPPLPPTPPPVFSLNPPMRSVANELGDDVSVSALSRPQTQGTASSGVSLHASDLLSQKSKLKPHEERKYNMLIQGKAESDGNFKIKALELQKQKDLLKSTSDPHPSQLADLTTVQPERLTGLADILKKVVNERRIVIETKESLDASMSESSWSNYED